MGKETNEEKYERVIPSIIKASSRVEMVTDKEKIKELYKQFEEEKKNSKEK